MDITKHIFTDWQIYGWENDLYNVFYIASILFFTFEILHYFYKRQMTWHIAGDVATNILTYCGYYIIIFFAGTAYLNGFYYFYENFSVAFIPNNIWTVIICVILADFAYYWEHRFSHSVRIAWASHTVHHSSPYFNLSVAYRFGPMDAFIPFIFHIPLVLIGFDPIVVLFSEAVVLLYQTFLHTEVIKKLPRFVEAIMNTPSHHRVHHGSNKQYIDKNYGGIFIIWDKIFHTFEQEDCKVIYGIYPQLKSIEPMNVFLHGYVRLIRDIFSAKGLFKKIKLPFEPPH